MDSFKSRKDKLNREFFYVRDNHNISYRINIMKDIKL